MLILEWAKVVVCSEVHIKHTNALRRQNVEFLNLEPGGTQNNRWNLKG